MAAALVLVLLARVPSADGLLLHDHGDHGLHAHAVALDDLSGGGSRLAWHHHHHHDDGRHEKRDDTDGCEHADSLFIFVNAPATATGTHCASGAVFSPTQRFSPSASPRLIQSSDSIETRRFSVARQPCAHSLRPVSALDALLSSSHALLL